MATRARVIELAVGILEQQGHAEKVTVGPLRETRWLALLTDDDLAVLTAHDEAQED